MARARRLGGGREPAADPAGRLWSGAAHACAAACPAAADRRPVAAAGVRTVRVVGPPNRTADPFPDGSHLEAALPGGFGGSAIRHGQLPRIRPAGAHRGAGPQRPCRLRCRLRLPEALRRRFPDRDHAPGHRRRPCRPTRRRRQQHVIVRLPHGPPAVQLLRPCLLPRGRCDPFHNPYQHNGLVLPELASAYLDRAWQRAGMIHRGGIVTDAFDAVGWTWGRSWQNTTE